MLGVKRQTQMDKVKAAVREAVAYVDEIASDERLRNDLRAAAGHGAEARDRIRKDVGDGGIATRLAHDRKLRKKLGEMLEDLDSAGERVRRKNRHRLRNAVLILVGVGALAAAVPNVRRWIGRRPSDDAVDVAVA